ncbi:MAG: FecR domain-containing protein [Candidatus Pseudobacter hemicellulosilyticus]|uniref:FecR domain-containing protein n=1 Tax=Candidatus Pseudobacter hemicellulosilyticus TaxID=3121375 RepID=A0AAJ5WS12_9BACT|nr:MAG: FecR domain-containing protein [Pseudobacter sp.]
MPIFNDLLQKFIRDELSAEELAAFLAMAKEPDNQLLLKQTLEQYMEAPEFTDLTAGMDMEHQFLQVLKRAGREQPQAAPVQRLSFLRRNWWAAAVLFLLLGAGGFFWWRAAEQQQQLAVQPAPIPPGKEGAILTLADGRQVVLDSLGNGVVALQNGATVVLQNGQLSYSTAGATQEEMSYNTMTTPKGRQFQILLPDGTRVWLNAASSIRFPTVFSQEERLVQVSGEAYFEVTPQSRLPFRVQVGQRASIEVLGTAFNVQAYPDQEAIATTLVQGSVKVNADHSVLLKPGQQALISAAKTIRVEPADIDKVTAWKNGYFNFENTSLREAMKQLERWYDISVEIGQEVPEIDFFGDLSRNVNLAELLEALREVGREAGVQFRIEAGRKLVVEKLQQP